MNYEQLPQLLILPDKSLFGKVIGRITAYDDEDRPSEVTLVYPGTVVENVPEDLYLVLYVPVNPA